MIWQHGTIYYLSKELFDFEDVYHFLSSQGLDFFMPEDDYFKSINVAGLMRAIDQQGGTYGLSYEAAKEEALNKDCFYLKLILNLDRGSFMGWQLVSSKSLFVQRLFFDELDKEEFDIAVKIIFEFFLSELAKTTLVGMYIDKEDRTEEFDWENFFSNEKARLDILPDTVCVRKEKLDYVKIADGYIVHPLNHGFYAITRDPAVLCCFPLS